MKERIEEFIENSEVGQYIKIDMMPISEITAYMKKYGYHYEDIETNGYQIDFWLKFIKDNEIITLSGSLFYGDFSLMKEKKE